MKEVRWLVREATLHVNLVPKIKIRFIKLRKKSGDEVVTTQFPYKAGDATTI
jgi:hypothetical protein